MRNMKYKYHPKKLDDLFEQAKGELDLRSNEKYYVFELMRIGYLPLLEIRKIAEYLEEIRKDEKADDSIMRVLKHDLEIFFEEVEQQLGFEADARRQESLEEGI